MQIWTASAILRYYLDPMIEFRRSESRGIGKSSRVGYFIVPHYGVERRQDFHDSSMIDLGPFVTSSEARNWSRRHLVEPAPSSG